MVPIEILRAIGRNDPDGGEREPTEQDYASFEAWVVKTYGPEVFRAYKIGGWDEPAY
jgi:hypothetical protein